MSAPMLTKQALTTPLTEREVKKPLPKPSDEEQKKRKKKQKGKLESLMK